MIFKCFIPIKTGYWFFDIFTICLAAIPYFLAGGRGTRMSVLPKIILWWHFSKIETSAPCLEITQQTFLLMKTSWRRLLSSSSEDIFKTSSRPLDQDQYIRLGHTSSSRLQDIFKTSSRHRQDVLPRRLAKTSSKRPQEVFKTSCKNVFKTSWRRF